MNRVQVNPRLLTWARERAGRDLFDLMARFPKLPDWEDGELQPTLRQLEVFARAVHVPIGYLFLPEPPTEPLPIPDFRTIAEQGVRRPSPNLLDTLYLCQQRQEWYRNYARMYGMESLAFVGNTQVGEVSTEAAERIRQALGLSAQMFTLAHELAHLWLGESGISDVEAGRVPDQAIELWCNSVAAEVLMPMDRLRHDHDPDAAVLDEVQRLARIFKVSTLVVLRRFFDAGMIDQPTLWECYRDELARIQAIDRGGTGGGNFYRTLGARTGKRFARAVLSSTLEGQTLFQDAFRMLGIRKTATFYEAAREMGVML